MIKDLSSHQIIFETDDFFMEADWCIFLVGELNKFGFLTFFLYRRFNSLPPDMWLITPWIGVPSSSYHRVSYIFKLTRSRWIMIKKDINWCSKQAKSQLFTRASNQVLYFQLSRSILRPATPNPLGGRLKSASGGPCIRIHAFLGKLYKTKVEERPCISRAS